jgi:hypothetical protein
MVQQIARILINPERASPLQLILSITSGKKTNAERLFGLVNPVTPVD